MLVRIRYGFLLMRPTTHDLITIGNAMPVMTNPSGATRKGKSIPAHTRLLRQVYNFSHSKKTKMPITFKQAEILGHSLGVNLFHAKQSSKKRDKKLPKEFYRNRFCAGAGHDDLPILQSLEKMGYMAQGEKINAGHDTLWYVTDEGIRRFRECFDSMIIA